MNSPAPVAASPQRRRIWPWILGALLTPVFLLGFAAFSFLTLNSEAATLRSQVMDASHSDWDTRVQVSVGRLSFGMLRTGLSLVPGIEEEVRLAMKTVRHASVGVYELADRSANWSREKLFADTDKAMARRGWTRLVGVAEDRNTVLVYVADDADLDATVDVCVAVVDGRNLVVVSANIDGDAIAKLVSSQANGKFSAKARHFRF